MVPYDLPEAKRIQYAALERRQRAKRRAVAGHLAAMRGLGDLTALPSDRLNELMAESQTMVRNWEPTTPDGTSGLTALEVLIADCREISDQMTELIEYVMGLQ